MKIQSREYLDMLTYIETFVLGSPLSTVALWRNSLLAKGFLCNGSEASRSAFRKWTAFVLDSWCEG